MKIQLSEHFTYGKLVRFCLPTIAMMIFTSVYGIVDGFFVSNYVGKTAFAGVNLIWPFLMIIGCFGFMIGTGGSALVSRTMGEGKADEANRYFTMLFYLTLISGVFLSVLGAVFIGPIARFLGATEEMLPYCKWYGGIMASFNFAFMLQFFFQSFFVTAGKPQLGFIATTVAGICNIVLDRLFVAVLDFGVAGAAAASVIGQVVGGVLPVFYFMRENPSLLKFTKTKMELRPLLSSCANGASELLSNISASLVGMLYNARLMMLAGEDGISAYGVLMYTQMIFAAVFIGYAIGTAPVIGYHYGAADRSELKSLRRKSTVLMLSSGIVMMGLAWLLASPLSQFFVGYDAELLRVTEHAFYIFAFSFVLAGFNIFASSFFTALSNGAVSAAISFLRTCVFQVAAVLLLPALFGGIDGIWWALTFAESGAFIVSTLFIIIKRKKYQY